MKPERSLEPSRYVTSRGGDADENYTARRTTTRSNWDGGPDTRTGFDQARSDELHNVPGRTKHRTSPGHGSEANIAKESLSLATASGSTDKFQAFNLCYILCRPLARGSCAITRDPANTRAMSARWRSTSLLEDSRSHARSRYILESLAVCTLQVARVSGTREGRLSSQSDQIVVTFPCLKTTANN